ncbi:MAG: response regulator [Anaerolineae bacterium]|nr:response regulator [Anaerolineae bacterium]
MKTIPMDLLDGWNVVVIDDEEDSLEVAQIILEEYGADVSTASNGHEGLEVIRRKRPKLVISDISMPVMDGWGLIFELKNDRTTCDIPVIALTAHAMIGDRERAISAGFHNYLTKPLTANTFIHDLVGLLVEIPQLALELPM